MARVVPWLLVAAQLILASTVVVVAGDLEDDVGRSEVKVIETLQNPRLHAQPSHQTVGEALQAGST